ncbi:DUF2061 domain-containing protein [Mesonia sp. K4-1]|uniref:DUF2061 domain-containing protein n=1 Tax=Mesonia sp. K4-1 TaxID=2602760 RepID=UPI0011C73233|nr:DUF2061 domain-containing protein [Mesonia sp. K4-1]TXK78522.1 DUF2061 domain-containing protein [Mesonia sp. K4-1]
MAQKISHKRHIAKAITWRCVGTIDTIILSWVMTGNPFTGLKIGFSETITKMLLYYAHERVWIRVNLDKNKELKESRLRHIIKTITWRLIGTIDTILLSWLISGDIITGLKIGGAELATKPILYYLHERVWYRSNYGIKKEIKPTYE